MVTGVSLKGICFSIANFQLPVSSPSIYIYIIDKILIIILLYYI